MARRGESKYDRLGEHLRGLECDRIELAFSQIEEITGYPLTHSQRNYDVAWSNSRNGGSVMHNQWLDNGWRVESKSLTGERVVFVRSGDPVAPRPDTSADASTSVDLAKTCTKCLMTLEIGSVVSAASAYGYANPVLCAIDAVWSLGVRYEAVRRAVAAYAAWASAQGVSPLSDTHSPAEALRLLSVYSPDGLADSVFRNRQLTSTKNCILKAEAVRDYLAVLADRQVVSNEDALAIKSEIEPLLRQVKGQSRGASTEYFFMLCGSDELVKPDRMIQRFVEDAIGRPVSPESAAQIVVEASGVLSEWVPGLTPRSLDRAIWSYQRDIGEE